MFSNRAVVAFVALGCVAAAGAGGYLAVRQSQTSAAIAAPAPASSPAPATPPASAAAATSDSNGKTPDAPSIALNDVPKPASATTAPGARIAAAPVKQSSVTKTAPASRNEQPSTPSIAPLQPEPAADAAAAIADAQPHQDDVRAQEIAQAPEPAKAPEKRFDELVVSADSVIGLRLETTINSERARVEDRVEARVARDVRVGGRVAIPTGSQVIGSVIAVERGGKFKEPARLEIRFNTLILADGSRLPISTEAIRRVGEAPSNGTAQKIGGGAIVGTILGGILGGAKGAAIGAAAGAGGGAAAPAAGDRATVTIPAGTEVTVRFVAPVAVTVER